MKVILSLQEQKLIADYTNARDAFQNAKVKAGAVLIALADGGQMLSAELVNGDLETTVEYKTIPAFAVKG